MIIDIHRHLVAKDWFSERFWKGYARMIQHIMAQTGASYSIEDIHTHVFSTLYDTDGEHHLEHMGQAGIEKTVVFLFDTGLLTGEPAVSIHDQHTAIFQSAKNYPDQIIPFVHIDPRRPGAIAFVQKCVEEWGAKGLKLHPGAGFNPEGSETLKLIEAIADYHIPVITHTGPSIPPTSSRYGDPINLDKLLLAFPEVNVIAAHLGYGYREQLCSLGWQRPNLYTDISVSQEIIRKDPHQFARILRHAMDAFGADRVLFGTDSPFTWGLVSERDFVNTIKDLPTNAPDDITFTEDEIDLLLGLNAKRLLYL